MQVLAYEISQYSISQFPPELTSMPGQSSGAGYVLLDVKIILLSEVPDAIKLPSTSIAPLNRTSTPGSIYRVTPLSIMISLSVQ